jgi:membrane associated rhomboid family serine protease
MIPIKDDNPHHQTPIVTYGLILVNILIYLRQLFLPAEAGQLLVMQYGAVPAQISHGLQLYTIVTSMFLHGGLMHLAGNMLYLYVFGDNVEMLCGHFRFLVFYLFCGMLAFFSHYIFAPLSPAPMIGASGAISGVLGAYALRFPGARVHVLIPLFIFFYRIRIPAVMVLGFWFLIQLFSGVADSGNAGGVAWFAHVGGFIAGLVLIHSFESNRYRITVP